ncbi:MAG TPA: nucleotidyl transferase AbiEii/AbiGii toxin family protein [Oculatellaceae cyanobacterium]
MIPRAYVQEWSSQAPWPDAAQIEQDLIISRALCDLFNAEALQGKIAFRGGTAINKLLFKTPLRYSEDIDLVQMRQEPIRETLAAMREALSWLGDFKYDQAHHSTHLTFKFSPESAPESALRLMVEINTREHEALYDLREYPFQVESEWYQSRTSIVSFEPEELFGTKLRALLQRRKNRDLFDLHHGLNDLALDTGKVIAAFEHYLSLQEQSISRAEAEERMLKKLEKSLTEDIAPLLPAGVHFSDDDALTAFGSVWSGFIAKISGDPWKLTDKIVDELRLKRLPNLLR